MALLLKGGTVVNFDQSFASDVLVRDGKIVQIGEGIVAKDAKVIDATGKYVMPGGIDPHVHQEMPFMGTVAIDDWTSGTTCAVAGGTTMVIDFIVPAVNGSIIEAYNTWHKRAKKALCDYSFHCCIVCWNPQIKQEMATLVKEGVTSFKHFLAYKGALMLRDEFLIESFQRCKELGALPAVHAENGDIVAWNQQKFAAAGMIGPEFHHVSRPSWVEGEAVERATIIAGSVNVPLMIVHNTCEESCQAIERAKNRGQRIYGEAMAAHLTLDSSRYYDPDWDVAAAHILSPPLRSKKHVDYLWTAVQKGTLDYVATDHCTFTKQQKRAGLKNFAITPNGLPGLEERMMLLWEQGVNTGRLNMNEFVALSSTHAAKIYNVYPRKGCVCVGADADLVIWDPKLEKTLSEKTHHSKVDISVFEGIKVRGAAACTIVGGVVAYQDGKILVEPGHGKYVPRPAFGTPFQGQDQKDVFLTPPKVERPEYQ